MTDEPTTDAADDAVRARDRRRSSRPSSEPDAAAPTRLPPRQRLRPRGRRGQGQRPAHGQRWSRTRSAPRSRRSSAHDADAALQVIVDDGGSTRSQRKATAMIAATIATQQPVARDLRYLLTLDHVSYELERMGDHAASVAKQARKLAPHAPLKRLRATCPSIGRAGRRPGARDHPRTGRHGRGSARARSRPSTTRSTTCTTRSSTRCSS